MISWPEAPFTHPINLWCLPCALYFYGDKGRTADMEEVNGRLNRPAPEPRNNGERVVIHGVSLTVAKRRTT